MKTILVPIESHEAIRPALETALMLARRFDSYVEGFALRFRVNEFVAVDMAGAIPLESLRDENLEEARRARQIFESFMAEQAVPRTGTAASSLSYGWLDEAPEGEGFVGSYGRVFDVIVMSRPEARTIGLHVRALESGLFESGRPVLLAPPSPPRQLGTNVLIAWNCSTEQARATALAMPLIRNAERVTVLSVKGGTEVPGPPADQAVQYLQRNGIAATLSVVDVAGRTTGEAVLAAAQSLNCDLLIKGAYTQSRLRQMIFGGATRHILGHATLPVLMAN
ncbi:MAG TPA: universal stress protein [Xanthobacteraceae bacterium]|jgi:nucleotide-binding universal stress UspA family protein|nr:universal stress protein [Xanthobacteraceae bacterium]